MRRVVALLVSLLIAAACSDDGGSATPTTPPPTTPPATTPAPTTTLFDAADPRPVLTVGLFDWGIGIGQPRDMTHVAVYGDGRVVSLRYIYDRRTYLLDTQAVGDTELKTWIELADVAGLDTPGVDPPEPLPEGFTVADGGYATVTRRSFGSVGSVTIDQPGALDNYTGPVNERRRALDALATALLRLGFAGAVDDGEPVGRWAVESSRPLASVSTIDWPWTEHDRDELAWVQSASGTWCAIVEDPAWSYVGQGYDEPGFFRRPLLPHEQTCDDVFAWRVELDMATEVPGPPYGLSQQA